MAQRDSRWKQGLRRSALAWFDRHARDLPWRRTRDPYHVWVSEIMLQQTQVVTVIPYFQRFLHEFPNIAALAAASETCVLRLWEGLGYYRRARQMHQAAQRIVAEHDGEFPRDKSTVQALPGIGRYTAGAILSIAFDAREPILEANTVRVFSRLLAYRGDPTSASGQQTLWQAAEDFLPRRRCGDFNQAMMELGSEICTPREPRCEACPVARLCPTRAAGLQALIPLPKKKTVYESTREACVVVWRDGRILLRRCEEGERWAGLWDFPRFPLKSAHKLALSRELRSEVERLTGVRVAAGDFITSIKHGVTRFRITLDCYHAEFLMERETKGELMWVFPEKLADFPLSATGRRVSQQLLLKATS